MGWLLPGPKPWGIPHPPFPAPKLGAWPGRATLTEDPGAGASSRGTSRNIRISACISACGIGRGGQGRDQNRSVGGQGCIPPSPLPTGDQRATGGPEGRPWGSVALMSAGREGGRSGEGLLLASKSPRVSSFTIQRGKKEGN